MLLSGDISPHCRSNLSSHLRLNHNMLISLNLISGQPLRLSCRHNDTGRRTDCLCLRPIGRSPDLYRLVVCDTRGLRGLFLDTWNLEADDSVRGVAGCLFGTWCSGHRDHGLDAPNKPARSNLGSPIVGPVELIPLISKLSGIRSVLALEPAAHQAQRDRNAWPRGFACRPSQAEAALV